MVADWFASWIGSGLKRSTTWRRKATSGSASTRRVHHGRDGDGMHPPAGCHSGLGPSPWLTKPRLPEMFGKVREVPQWEATPFHPGVRMPAPRSLCTGPQSIIGNPTDFSNGILFKATESTRRGETFVTRKSPLRAARIKWDLKDRPPWGNLDSRRDWGYAKEYASTPCGACSNNRRATTT